MSARCFAQCRYPVAEPPSVHFTEREHPDPAPVTYEIRLARCHLEAGHRGPHVATIPPPPREHRYREGAVRGRRYTWRAP